MQKSLIPKIFSQLEVTYLSCLKFEDEALLEKVKALCEKEKIKGRIGKKEKWLGALYEKEIEEGCIASVSVLWVNDRVEYGLFAKEDLPINTYIGEYVGKVRKFKKRLDSKNAYCFEYPLGKRTPFTIDAKESGNEIRFINHSYQPNLEPIAIYCQNVMHVILRTNQFVKKGSELTYDYGEQYWKKREKPI